MWKKVQNGGKVPYLSRWYETVSKRPECIAAVDQLDLNAAKRKAAAAGDSIESKKGGGGECSRMLSARFSSWPKLNLPAGFVPSAATGHDCRCLQRASLAV